MQSIKGGLLADVTNFLKTISDIVFKAFDKLNEMGVFTEGLQRTDDGGFTGKITTEKKDKVIEFKCTPANENGDVFNFECKVTKGKAKNSSAKYSNIKEAELQEYLTKAIQDTFGESVEKWVGASTTLKFALKRVVGATEDTIELCKVVSNMPPADTLNTINSLLVDEFVETIPEEETWYSVDPTVYNGEEYYDVQNCEACDVPADVALYQYLKEAFHCLSVFQAVHWNARGDGFFTLHEKLDTYISKIQSDIDTIAELIKVCHSNVPAPATIYKEIETTNTEMLFDLHGGFQVINDAIVVYCMTLDCYYCNLPHDIQPEIDNIMSYWQKESQYKLMSLLS